MASSAKLLCFVLFFACSLVVQGTTEHQVICEKLPSLLCSYAVSSSGKRCVLETEGKEVCKTSEIRSERLSGYIENNQCVNSCGVARRSVGMTPDAFLSPEFTSHLCRPSCYHNCPNIIDYYSNLAAGEGLSLPAMCEKMNGNSNRGMAPAPSMGYPFDAAAARRAALALLFGDAPVPAPAPAPSPSPASAYI